MSKAFTVPMTAASAAIGALTGKTGAYADKVLGLETATGLATDTLQEFGHATAP
jgi:hypothetical protein